MFGTHVRSPRLPRTGALLFVAGVTGIFGCAGAPDAARDKQGQEAGQATTPPPTTAERTASPAPVESAAPTTSPAEAAPTAVASSRTTSAKTAPQNADQAADPQNTNNTPSSDGPIGVAACDKYISLMRRCLNRMDPTARSATETSFDQTVDAWKLAASQGPVYKEVLAQGCEAAVAALPPTCK